MVSKSSGIASKATPVLLRGTERWQQLWDKAMEEGRLVEQQLSGWSKFAKELWALSRAIIDIVQSGKLKCRYMRGVATDTSEDLNEFIHKYEQTRRGLFSP